MPCPNFETLIDFADGQLAAEERPAVERHLAGACGACRDALAWYAGFVVTAQSDESVEPPAWLTRRAVGIFADAREAAARRGLRGVIARLRAALVFDSFAGALAGEALPARETVGGSRQLLYHARPYDVDLLIAGGDSPSGLVVTGQVLTPDGEELESVSGLTVTVERSGETVATAETSALGEFTLAGIAPGVYDLRLAGAEREILLAGTPLSVD
jgi:hypothetical protein